MSQEAGPVPLTEYYRGALLVPLVLPLFCLAILMVSRGGETLPGIIAVPAMFIGLGAIAYFVPYAVVIAALWRRSRGWSLRTYHRLLVLLPLAFAVGFLVIAAGSDLYSRGRVSTDSWAAASAALAVGYVQAALIACGAWLGKRFGWLVQTPASTAQPTISANVA